MFSEIEEKWPKQASTENWEKPFYVFQDLSIDQSKEEVDLIDLIGK